jgi:DNA repair protein RadC
MKRTPAVQKTYVTSPIARIVPSDARKKSRTSADDAPAPRDAFEGMLPHELAVIEAARSILRARLRCSDCTATESPAAARELVRLHLGGYGHEVFAVLFFDGQNRFVALEEMFRGTLTQTSVYPREVVRAALRHGAASVILAHNHPSGASEPSRADEFLTHTLKSALALVDVRVHDHFVVGADHVMSFAERGLL